MFRLKSDNLLLSLVAAGAIAGLAAPGAVYASEHIDAPLLAQDRGSDLADLWAFLDPNDNSKVVLIMSTQGFVVSGEHFGMGILITTSDIASK